MSTDNRHPATERLLRRRECVDAVDLLTSTLPGSDATTLLLETMARRARDLSAADVLAQYRRDRFVAPAEVDPVAIARLRLLSLESLASDFNPVETSPLAPLGSHSALAGVNQNNVVTTVRMSEVAADPTNQLALEAALRRQELLAADPKSSQRVALCAEDRVVRAQVFEGARSFAHFSLLGAVIAGRSTGGHRFEIESLTRLLRGLADFVALVSDHPIAIQLSDLDGGYPEVVAEVCQAVTSDRVTGTVDDGRTRGRGYYPNVCFKLTVDTGRELVEVGDGGSVDWTRALLHSAKERLVIGGISLERLALL